MKKRIICMCMAFILIFSLTAFAGGTSGDISVIVNGKRVGFDQPPIIRNSRTLVPMRAIFEALGYEVNWDDGEITVLDEDGKTVMYLTVGVDVMGRMENGRLRETKIDVPPQIVNDRTLVPVRVISESIGAEVNWNGESKTVTITFAEKKECEHENTYESINLAEREYEQSDEDEHIVIDIYEEICEDCGEAVETSKKISYEEHSFRNGVCSACGYKEEASCKHKSTRDVISIDERRYKQNGSDSTHTVVDKVNVYCNDCGEKVESKTKNSTAPHDFEDGYCIDCGYKEPKKITRVSPGNLDIDDDGNFKVVKLQPGEGFVVTNEAENSFKMNLSFEKGGKYSRVVYDENNNTSTKYLTSDGSLIIKSGCTAGIYNQGSVEIEVKAPSEVFFPTDSEDVFVIKALNPGKSCSIHNNTKDSIRLGFYCNKGDKLKYDYVVYDDEGEPAATKYATNSSYYILKSGYSMSISNSGDAAMYIYCPARVADIR